MSSVSKGITKQKKTTTIARQTTLITAGRVTSTRASREPLVVIISGTRHDLSQEQKEFVRRTIRDFVASKNPRMVQGFQHVKLVHGGCPTGVDNIADDLAREEHWELDVFPADWASHGKSAGPKRNREMLKTYADAHATLLAFPAPDSTGTINCIETAKKLKYPEHRILRFDVETIII